MGTYRWLRLDFNPSSRRVTSLISGRGTLGYIGRIGSCALNDPTAPRWQPHLLALSTPAILTRHLYHLEAPSSENYSKPFKTRLSTGQPLIASCCSCQMPHLHKWWTNLQSPDTVNHQVMMGGTLCDGLDNGNLITVANTAPSARFFLWFVIITA